VTRDVKKLLQELKIENLSKQSLLVNYEKEDRLSNGGDRGEERGIGGQGREKEEED
jgi:hypothetical protein